MDGKKEDEKEELLKKKARNISIKEGSAFSLMDGFGLKYITPYALALGANNAQIGILGSVPGLLGNLSQLYTIRILEKTKRKKIITLGVFLQALMWLPLLAIGILHFYLNLNSDIATFSLIIVYSLLIIFGSFTGPAWNSWMKDIVTEKSGEYFGLRNKITGIVALISMLVAGFILDHFKKDNLMIGFSILFIIALIGRSTSAFLFTRKHEPKIKYKQGYYFSFTDFAKKMYNNNFGKFVIYMSIMSLVQFIAAPFFAVYMLKDLNLNYLSYTLVTISAVLTTLLVMPLWGKFSDKYGNLKTLKICSFLVLFEPLLWMLSPIIKNFGTIPLVIYLIVLSAFTGVIWAGFNLSEGNFIYDAVSRQRIALCFAYFNIINGIGIFIGALLGGLFSSSSISLFGLTPLLIIFAISGIGRFIVHFTMAPRIKEVREIKKFKIRHLTEKIKNLNAKQLWDYLGIKRGDI